MRILFVLIFTFFLTTFAQAGIVITVYQLQPIGLGKKLGTVRAEDTIYGLLLTPNLKGLSPGIHGFHIHQYPFCEDDAKGAGGHLDPRQTNLHHGPYRGDGHLGDMAVLIVDKQGKATLPVLAPRLKLDLIKNRSLMIHAKGDNYADSPEPMGGGGSKVACGAINYF